MKPPRDGPVVVLAVLVGAGYMFPIYLTGALSVEIRADLGLSATRFGAVVSVFFALGGVLMPFGGRIVDRIGAATAVRLSVAAAAACLAAAAAFGSTVTGLVVALAVGGLGTAVAGPVGGMLIARGVGPAAAPRAFALERSSIPAATLLAGLAVPTLAAVLHWRAVFLCSAVAVALVALVPVPPLSRPRRQAGGGALRPIGPLLGMTGVFFLGSAAATAMSAFLVGYGVASGTAAGVAGVALATASAATIGVRLVLGFTATGRPPGQRALAALLLVGAAGFGVLALPSPVAFWGGAVLAAGAGWGWTGIAGHAVVTAHANAPGAATAVIQAGGCIGGVAGPLVMGVLTDSGSYTAGLLSLAGFLVLAALTAGLNRGIWARSASQHPATGMVDRAHIGNLTSERNSVRLNGTTEGEEKGAPCPTDR
ncbi:MFS transporter [Lentzea sp. E54]|uniref:MFS transporter n=1 Tax=Lentzea xerophila TaxID=3435883 RepID=UPI003DA66395